MAYTNYIERSLVLSVRKMPTKNSALCSGTKFWMKTCPGGQNRKKLGYVRVRWQRNDETPDGLSPDKEYTFPL